MDGAKLLFQRKKFGFSIRNVLLHHYNVRPHAANQTREKLDRMFFWTSSEHLPYSPDLSPCDHHMLGLLKVSLEGQRFDSYNGVMTFVRNWFDRQPLSFYEN